MNRGIGRIPVVVASIAAALLSTAASAQNLTVQGAITSGQGASVGGSLAVGSVTATGAGNASFQNNVVVGASLDVGNVTTTGIGNAAIQNNLSVGGSLNVGGSLTVRSAPLAIVPTGAVLAFAGSSAPSGFLVCNGDAVSRTTYAALFAVIGITYGQGNGSTTFNLPDLRADFIRGLDNMGGTPGARNGDPGRSPGTEQLDAFQGHYHQTGLGSWDTSANVSGYGRYPDFSGATGPNPQRSVGAPITDGSHNVPRTASETRPRNVAMYYIIKS
jgi:microcystin-dependent protein